MKTIALLAILLTLGNCSYYYQNSFRDYYTQISGTLGRAIAMSPSTVTSAMGYNIDFAIGTLDGWLYFGNLNDYDLKYSTVATSYEIKNLTWTSIGLHITTNYEIKVVNPSLANWNILYMVFNYQRIHNAVYSYK